MKILTLLAWMPCMQKMQEQFSVTVWLTPRALRGVGPTAFNQNFQKKLYLQHLRRPRYDGPAP